MSEDIVKESIKCLANMEIKETTYQVARSVVLDEIERLNNIIKTKDEGIKAFTEDLCEESTKIEKAIEYIEDRFTIENGEYYLTHTFNKDNVKELYDILRGDKE